MTLLLLALATPTASANDILVPEFTPESISDFAAAFLVYDSVLGDLRDEGVSYVDGDAIRARSGDKADACADVSDCPAVLFNDFDAGLAIVGSVRESSVGLDITIRFYAEGEETAVRVLSNVVSDDQQYAFTAEAAKIAAELIAERGGAGGVDLSDVAVGAALGLDEPFDDGFDDFDSDPVADTFDTPDSANGIDPDDFTGDDLFDTSVEDFFNTPTEPEEPDDEPYRAPLEAEEAPPPSSWSQQDEERRQMKVRERSFNQYQASGMSQGDWMSENRVRAKQISVELTGGLGLGATDSAYDVRVALLRETGADATQEQWSQYGQTSGSGFQGGLGLGYHFNSWVEAGVFVGAVRGSKNLSAGWEGYLDEQPVDGDAYDYQYEAVSAWQALVEPRARLYALDTGMFKPYGLLGLSFRVADGTAVPVEDIGVVDYPAVEGGSAVDGVIGGGLALDLSQNAGLVLEVPFGLNLRNGDASTSSDYITDAPAALDGAGYLMRVSLGAQARF